MSFFFGFVVICEPIFPDELRRLLILEDSEHYEVGAATALRLYCARAAIAPHTGRRRAASIRELAAISAVELLDRGADGDARTPRARAHAHLLTSLLEQTGSACARSHPHTRILAREV